MPPHHPPLQGVYAITPDTVDTDQLLSWARAVAAGGGRWLQYRNKRAGAAQQQDQAARLADFCKNLGLGLIINDDWALAMAVDAAGAHLGGDDGDLAVARAALGSGKILGVTCYNRDDRVDMALAAGADYVAVGAVYPSATKPAAVRADLGWVAGVCQRVNVPVVAIGGISRHNAAPLVTSGVSMAAVISDLFGDESAWLDEPEVTQRVSALQAVFTNFQNP